MPVVARLATSRADAATPLSRSTLAASPWRVATVGDAASAVGDAASVKLIRDWQGDICRSRVVNEGRQPLRVREIVLFDVQHGLPPETALYGEGFQMLSQTAG